MKTLIYSGFPGIGKTTLFNTENKSLSMIDSDSSTFDKSQFPQNYIEHIKQHINKVNIICVSSHETVRQALVENNITFNLVYPQISLKYEYLVRYNNRGNNKPFLALLHEQWDTWITQLQKQQHCTHMILPSNTFLTDIIHY